MNKPLISIIVPVYNGEATIEECVASISLQTYGNIELIIIDDGSDDNTASIIEMLSLRFDNINIKTANTVRRGVSAARNLGIDMAKGEYIAFLDADDTYLPDAMEYLFSQMKVAVDITVAQFEEFPLGEHIITSEEAVEATLYQHAGFHESPCAKLFRRTIFDSGIRFAEGRRYEDMEICPDLYMRAREIAISGRKVYNYTKNPLSFINNWSPGRLDALWAVDSISAKWGHRFPGGCRHRNFSASFNIFNLACGNGEKLVADRCWERIRQMRLAIISDRRSRTRNRLSAIGSYLGKHLTSTAVRAFRLYGK